MILPPLAHPPIVLNWLERHAKPVSFALHMVGIPMTIMGVLLVPVYVYMVSMPIFVLSSALFGGGYVMQFLGHAFEGSEPGEVAFLRKSGGAWVRKRLRKPIAASAPQTSGPIA